MEKQDQKQQGRQRAYKPKVRTGCITCRTRKVKCDEEKPSCKRCRVFGVQCDGYAKSTSKAPKQLLPSTERPVQLLKVAPSARVSKNNQEHILLQAFQTYMGVWIDGPHDSRIWDYLMLQEAHRQPFVKHALLAISALNSANGGGPLANHTSHQVLLEYSLRQYVVAVQHMRTSQLKSENPIRTALLACILVTTYESLAGRPFDSARHAIGGIRILQDWIKKKSSSNTCRDWVASPAPSDVEDVIIHAFTRLDRQALALPDIRSRNEHRELMNAGICSIENMPHSFATIQEAQQFLALVATRSAHFAYDLEEELRITGDETRRNELLASVQERLRHFQMWESAFVPLQKSLESDLLQHGISETLYIHWLKAKMWLTLSSPDYQTDHPCDQHLDDFRLILAKAKRSIEITRICHDLHSDNGFPFASQYYLLPNLHTVARFARDRLVRREAIALLRCTFWREGLWEGKIVANFNERLMEIEEDGVDTYKLPDDAYITGIYPKADSNGIARTVVVTHRGGVQRVVHLDPGFELNVNMVLGRQSACCLLHTATVIGQDDSHSIFGCERNT